MALVAQGQEYGAGEEGGKKRGDLNEEWRGGRCESEGEGSDEA